SIVEERLSKPPAGVELGSLASKEISVLSEYTAFPWPVMLAQSRRRGVDPARITPDDLRELLPLLSAGVERFTSPQKGEAVRQDLERLLRGCPGGPGRILKPTGSPACPASSSVLFAWSGREDLNLRPF